MDLKLDQHQHRRVRFWCCVDDERTSAHDAVLCTVIIQSMREPFSFSNDNMEEENEHEGDRNEC